MARAPGPILPGARHRAAGGRNGGTPRRAHRPGAHAQGGQPRGCPRRGAAHGERGGRAGSGTGAGGADAEQRHLHRAGPRPLPRQASWRGPDGTPDAAAVQDIAAAKAAVLGHRDVLVLHDRETGEAAGRFSTRTVREQERAALADAGGRGRSAGTIRAYRPGTRRRRWPLAACARTSAPRSSTRSSAGGLKLIEGRAGTGKSYTLAAVREAHEAAGHRVVGLAPTNAVAQDLKADGFRRGEHGPCGAVRDQERAHGAGQAHGAGGGRGGDAGQPGDRASCWPRPGAPAPR